MLDFLDLCRDETQAHHVADSPEKFAALLDALLAAGFDPARGYAIGFLVEQDALAGPFSLVAAEVLARRCAAHVWPALWKLIVSDDTFARELFLRLASRYRFDTPFYAGVGEADVAELYILLERLFPKVDDPVHESGEAHWIGPRESLGDIRTGVPMSVWVRLPPYKPCAGSSRRYPIWFGYLSN